MVAGRLAENPDVSVAVVEAGARYVANMASGHSSDINGRTNVSAVTPEKLTW